MNESIYLNLTPAGESLLNSTGYVIEIPPFQTIETLLFSILIILIIQLFLTLWFSRRHLQ